MRFMQIYAFYWNYLEDFYRRFPEFPAWSFAQQTQALLDDGFYGSHMIAPYMKAQGYETSLVIANCYPAQQRWAAEQGMAQPQTTSDMLFLLARQIDAFKPDILYVTDPMTHDSTFLSVLTHKPKLIVGWRAARIPSDLDWTLFDLIVSSDEGCRKRALEVGAKAAAPFWPGFPTFMADRVAKVAKDCDVMFTGQVTYEHRNRIEGLQAVGKYGEAHSDLAIKYYLAPHKDQVLPPEIRRYDQGAVWGYEMYRALRAGKIALNFHIDLAVAKSQNMRLIEGTGVGAFMLTEADPHLAESFIPGKEVEVYASHDELVEKIAYYSTHDAEREEIARRGQARCLADNGMERRAVQFDDILREHLAKVGTQAVPSPAAGVGRLLKSAAAFMAQNNIQEASETLSRAVQLQPRNADVLQMLGRLACTVGQFDQGTQIFQTATVFGVGAPNEWLYHADLGVALSHLSQWNSAVEAYAQAALLNPLSQPLADRIAALRRRADDAAAQVAADFMIFMKA